MPSAWAALGLSRSEGPSRRTRRPGSATKCASCERTRLSTSTPCHCIGGGKARQALRQAFGEGFCLGGVRGLAGERLDHRQQVVGAMVELGQQQADMLFCPLALGNVDVDATVAHRLAVLV